MVVEVRQMVYPQATFFWFLFSSSFFQASFFYEQHNTHANNRDVFYSIVAYSNYSISLWRNAL